MEYQFPQIIKAFILSLLIPTITYGQSFDIHPTKHREKEVSVLEDKAQKLTLLNQANILATNSVPKVRVNALKYYLGISDNRWVPFYIFTTTPAETKDEIDSTVDSLLDPEGGILNLKIAYDKKITLGEIFKFESPQEGLFINLNAGTKIIEGVSETISGSEIFIVAYGNAELKIQLPLGSEPLTTTNRVGGLKIGIDVSINHAFGDDYRTLFTDEPDRTFYNLNGIVSFWITNKMYIAVGGTIASSENEIDKRSYVSFSIAQ